MINLLWGATACGCLVIGMFFFRFWRDTRDRLFLCFGTAFTVFSFNWALLAALNPSNETRHYFYLVRLAAFLLILAGIIDKNRGSRRT
jgi:hypothetical protein